MRERFKFSPWTSWRRDFQGPADLACQKIGDFAVAWDRFPPSGCWIPIDRVGRTFAFEGRTAKVWSAVGSTAPHRFGCKCDGHTVATMGAD